MRARQLSAIPYSQGISARGFIGFDMVSLFISSRARTSRAMIYATAFHQPSRFGQITAHIRITDFDFNYYY